jgi:hypothetical protein
MNAVRASARPAPTPAQPARPGLFPRRAPPPPHGRNTVSTRKANPYFIGGATAGATLVPAAGPTGLGVPSTIDAVIERTGKGTGPGNDERIEKPTVQIDDPLASLWAYFTLTRAGETKIDRCGTNLFLLRKGPDGWKVFQIAATSRTEGCRAIVK